MTNRYLEVYHPDIVNKAKLNSLKIEKCVRQLAKLTKVEEIKITKFLLEQINKNIVEKIKEHGKSKLEIEE